ncbi:putative quinol monooxygenase [Fluviicola sp.]|uniref:putative quinol monooxygenase n=1 Tax=Fluviicola sp. TaxID=1917219 RepID=UPI0031E10044
MEKTLIVKWKIREDKLADVLKFLPELAAQTQQEPGNKLYAVYQSEQNPGELILHETYADELAVEAHRNSEHYQRIVVNEIIPHLETREIVWVKQLF